MNPPDQVALTDEFEDLNVVAKQLKVTAARLRAWSIAGKFPPVLTLSSRSYRVRRKDLDLWIAGRWIRALPNEGEISPEYLERAGIASPSSPPPPGRAGSA